MTRERVVDYWNKFSVVDCLFVRIQILKGVFAKNKRGEYGYVEKYLIVIPIYVLLISVASIRIVKNDS